jgi:hypothetical protein
VTSIDKRAFVSGTNLESITIPASVAEIGTSCFDSCFALTSVIFNGSSPTLGMDVFNGVPAGASAIVSAAYLASFGEVGSNWNGLNVISLGPDLYSKPQQEAVIAQRDALPTQAAYDSIVAQLETRYTAE